MLSEDDIKRKFLPFLKEFYKYRYEYRPESLHSELDSVSQGGRLIADGMVQFRKSDGAPFVATYEATSVDKSEEVKFSLDVLYFTWDCLAFGAVVAVVAYAVAFVTRVSWLMSLQIMGNVGFVFGMALIGFFCWYFSMRGWKKYRYIYAIEQFKQYYADEQWIALADDVFPSPLDPYLLELKNQCVYNGFGLALVSDSGDVRVVATPSRLGMYGKDRRMVHWVTQREWFQAVSQNMSTLNRYRPSLPDEARVLWNKIWRPVQYLLIDPVKKTLWEAYSKPLGEKNALFGRFMHAHTVQKWIFTLALVAIAPMAHRVLTFREDNVQDVVEMPPSNPEDQFGYLYEGENAGPKDPRGIPKQYPVKASPSDLTATSPAATSPARKRPGIPSKTYSREEGIEDEPETFRSTQTISPAGASTVSEDPCAQARKLNGWILYDRYYPKKTLADERAAALRRNGMEAEVIPRGCLDSEVTGFLVRLGKVQPTEIQAVRLAEDLTRALERYGLWQSELMLRLVKPK